MCACSDVADSDVPETVREYVRLDLSEPDNRLVPQADHC